MCDRTGAACGLIPDHDISNLLTFMESLTMVAATSSLGHMALALYQ